MDFRFSHGRNKTDTNEEQAAYSEWYYKNIKGNSESC